MLDVIKDIKPCSCGCIPTIEHMSSTDNAYPEIRIECTCGRKLETDNCTIFEAINKWNNINIPLSRRVMGGITSMRDYTGFFEVGEKILQDKNKFEIERVIFNDPATIVFWKDGTKTVVKAVDEPFDEEKGLAMAIVKKVYGNKGNYFNKIKKFLISRYIDDEGEIE